MLTIERALKDNIPASQIWNVAVANEELASEAYANRDGSRGDRLAAQAAHLFDVAGQISSFNASALAA